MSSQFYPYWEAIEETPGCWVVCFPISYTGDGTIDADQVELFDNEHDAKQFIADLLKEAGRHE